MKRAHPKLSSPLSESTIEVMVDDGELESAHIHDETAVNCNVAALHVTDTLFEDVQLTGSHLSRLVARDVVFRRCDLSSASLDNGMVVRTEFVNCRMTGIDFSFTNIHDVAFIDCKLDGGLFDQADLRRVRFEGCSLVDTDLSAARQYDVEQ